MADTYEPKSLMGWIFALGGVIVGFPLGAIKGAVDAVDGRSFTDGMENFIEMSFEKGGAFGDKHGGRIVRGVIFGIITHGLFDAPDVLPETHDA